MRRTLVLLGCLLAAATAHTAARQHVISFGQALPVKLFIGPSQTQSVDLKVRALYVDGRLREFTTGEVHDVTDRLFVVRRAFRVNDALPEEGKPPKWKWQRGGWLAVDRSTGRVSQAQLPEFDTFYSAASWYRDYAAYCGISPDGEKLYAIVAQLGRRKPLVRKELGAAGGGDMPESECPSPGWQRQPVRVTFQPHGGEKLTFIIRGYAADFAGAHEE
jgi:hypothetical protein